MVVIKYPKSWDAFKETKPHYSSLKHELTQHIISATYKIIIGRKVIINHTTIEMYIPKILTFLFPAASLTSAFPTSLETRIKGLVVTLYGPGDDTCSSDPLPSSTRRLFEADKSCQTLFPGDVSSFLVTENLLPEGCTSTWYCQEERTFKAQN